MTEAEARALLADAPFGVLVVELARGASVSELRVVWANRAHELLTGFPHQKSAGQRVLDLFPTFARDRMVAAADCIADGQPRTLTDPTAELFYVGDQRVAIVFETPRPWELEATRSIEAIIENLPAMVFMKDARELRYERFNRAAEALLGWRREDVIGKTSHELFGSKRADPMVEVDAAVLATGRLIDVPAEQVDTPRGPRWLHTRKIPLAGHVLGVSLDVTEQLEAEAMLRRDAHALAELARARVGEVQQAVSSRRRAEEQLRTTEAQLRQAQKLEAIGRLAGGIAHDFNNLLSVVLSYTALAVEGVDAHQPSHADLSEDLQEIRRAGESAAELTRQLLAFSRQQLLHPRRVDLNGLLQGLERMLTRITGDTIQLTLTLSHELAAVRADPGPIEQVVMNLVLNARDAMPSGGQLTIETANVVLDEAYVRAHVGASAGPHVMLAVSDTGIGMDAATVARIFEPFFTTKGIGRGTGLGLSTVFGIIKQSGGGIWVYSEPGRGSTFKVYLPALSSRARDVVDADAAPPPPPQTDGGHETLLLVEDDEQVRRLAQRVLERLGYTVLVACDGGDALRVATMFAEQIELLVTDVVMPVMGGRAVAAELRRLRPDVQVVYMSGYTDDAVMQAGALEAGATFLQKPLTPQSLARAVRAALDARA